jgi:hypothetical protein
VSDELWWSKERATLWGVDSFREAEKLLSEPRGGWRYGYRKRPTRTEKDDERNELDASNYDPRSENDRPRRPSVDSDKKYLCWEPLNLDASDNTVSGSGSTRLRAAFPTGGWRATIGEDVAYRGKYRGYVENEEELRESYRKSKGRAIIRCTYCGAAVRSRDLRGLLKWWRVHC